MAGVAAGVVAITTVAAAFVWRVPLVERALTGWLAASGIENPRLSVRTLGPRHIVLSDMQFGRDGAVVIGNATAAFTLAGLFDGRLGALQLSGVRIRGTLGADGLNIPGISLADDGGATGPALPFDSLALDDAALDLAMPSGSLALHFSGSLASQGEAVDALIDVTDGMITAVDAKLRGVEGELRLRLERGGSPIGAGTVRLTASAVQIAVAGETITGRARLTAELDDHLVRIEAGIETPRGTVRAALPLELSLKNGLQAAGMLDVTANNVAVAGLKSSRAKLIAPLHVQNRPEGIAISLAAPAILETAELDAVSGFRAALPKGAMLEASGRPLFETHAGGWRTAFHLKVPALDIASDGKQINGLDLAFEWRGGTDASGTYAGSGALNFTEVRLNNPALVLTEGRTEIAALEAKPATVRLAATLSHAGATPLFAPLGVAGHIVETALGFRIEATLTDGTGAGRIAIAGPWPLDTAKEALTVEILPVTFAPGGVQPAALSTWLEHFENVSGRAGGMLRIHAGAQGPEAVGELRLSDFAFALAGLAVEGMNVDIRINGLMPPTTPPDQTLTIRRVELGIALENINVGFHLAADASGGANSALVVRHAAAETLGGTIALSPATFALAASRHAATVRLDNLRLDRALELLGLDGVSGTGVLSGTVPLTIGIADGTLAINNARLGALGGGTLKVRSERAAQLLQGQGEQIDMAIRALEDFRYDTLTLELDKAPDAEARARLRLYGHNPAVLDGRPFHFNVNVQSNVNQLIEALLKGSALASEQLRLDAPVPRP